MPDDPSIVFPENDPWSYVRDLGDVTEEVRDIILRYHDGDNSITAIRYGQDKMTLREMVQGVCLDVDVAYSAEDNEYIVLSVTERE